MNERPRLVALMPGAIMCRMEPLDIAPTDLDVTRQTRTLVNAAAFSGVATIEREALIESIAQTIARADYHFRRFQRQRQRLDEVRRWAPGDVLFDTAVMPLHFELQALAGAARLLVDEILFLLSKRYGAGEWVAVPLIRNAIIPGSPVDVPEVHRLRAHRDWFDLLNAFRNVFFHSGWSHGQGHFGNEAPQAAKLPQMNGLLVPDRASLGGRSRSYQWTYNDATTVDDVANGIYHGMIDLLGELCLLEWMTGVPPAGTIAESDRPNLMVALPIPITLTIEDVLLSPIFSSREKAVAFANLVPDLKAKSDAGALELKELSSCPDVAASTESISFSFAKLAPDPAIRSLRLCLDPVPKNAEWTNIDVAAVVEVPLEDLLKDKMRIVSLPVKSPTTVFLWRTPFLVR